METFVWCVYLYLVAKTFILFYAPLAPLHIEVVTPGWKRMWWVCCSVLIRAPLSHDVGPLWMCGVVTSSIGVSTPHTYECGTFLMCAIFEAFGLLSTPIYRALHLPVAYVVALLVCRAVSDGVMTFLSSSFSNLPVCLLFSERSWKNWDLRVALLSCVAVGSGGCID